MENEYEIISLLQGFAKPTSENEDDDSVLITYGNGKCFFVKKNGTALRFI